MSEPNPDDVYDLEKMRRVALLIGESARARDVAMVGELLGIGSTPTESQMFGAIMDLWADGKKVVLFIDGPTRVAEIRKMDFAAEGKLR